MITDCSVSCICKRRTRRRCPSASCRSVLPIRTHEKIACAVKAGTALVQNVTFRYRRTQPGCRPNVIAVAVRTAWANKILIINGRRTLIADRRGAPGDRCRSSGRGGDGGDRGLLRNCRLIDNRISRPEVLLSCCCVYSSRNQVLIIASACLNTVRIEIHCFWQFIHIKVQVANLTSVRYGQIYSSTIPVWM